MRVILHGALASLFNTSTQHCIVSRRFIYDPLQSDYIRGANMKLVSGAARIWAGAIAVSVTFAIVWSMAILGYPGKVDANLQLAAAPPTRASQ